MFGMHPQTLETEVARRREVLRATMRASRGIDRIDARVAGTMRIRHAMAMLTMARS
jgi:hypothetical protein